MPYILYSLKTDRAKYLSASVVSPKGTCDALHTASAQCAYPAVKLLAVSC